MLLSRLVALDGGCDEVRKIFVAVQQVGMGRLGAKQTALIYVGFQIPIQAPTVT